jgi:hypothetical protein
MINFLASNIIESSVRSLLGITMNHLVNALILFMSLGCTAYSSHSPGMVYGFDNVSLKTLPNHIL